MFISLLEVSETRGYMINTFRVTLTILGKCCMRSLELQNKLLMGVSA